MNLPVQALLAAVGLVVGLAGVRIERPAVMLVGFVPGAVAGATFAPRLVADAGDPGTLVVVVLGALVVGAFGAQLAWSAWVLAHVLPGFAAGVMVSAPALGVTPSTAGATPETAAVVVAGFVGAMLAWALHRVFVVAVTATLGGVLVSVAAFGERVYVPAVRALAAHPELELTRVADSIRDIGTPLVALAVVFAVVQLGLLAQDDEGP